MKNVGKGEGGAGVGLVLQIVEQRVSLIWGDNPLFSGIFQLVLVNSHNDTQLYL